MIQKVKQLITFWSMGLSSMLIISMAAISVWEYFRKKRFKKIVRD
ncbi:MAG: hypothetical protein OEX81_03600 [Candidatus Pacebacteria bacterium]|nr:hypothetical protein [Candidatus Paceibacterota bacterium]